MTPLSELIQPQKVVRVEPETSRIIFYYEVSKRNPLFITHLYHNWSVGLRWTIEVDGEKIEWNVERQLGRPEKPINYDPPIVCERYIKVMVSNDSDEQKVAEFIIDGYFVTI